MDFYRVVESSTGRIEWFETRDREYLTWLLPPANEDPVSDELAYTGRYQWELVSLAMQLLPQSGWFLDIGAYVGAWSLLIAKARPDLRIDAYEPQIQAFGQLCANIFFNHLHTVRPSQFALGAHSGHAQLRLPNPKNRATATLVGEGAIVASVAVQTLAETHIGPDLIKLSVNGAETAVLSGGAAMLKRRLPLIIVEAPDPMSHQAQVRTQSLVQAVEKLGYAHLPLLGRHFIAFPEKRRAEVTAAWDALKPRPADGA